MFEFGTISGAADRANRVTMIEHTAETTDVQDAALASRLQSGVEGAWDDCYERFNPLIKSIVSWRKWGFPSDVQEDVAQTVRMELGRALERYRGDTSLKHFVKRVTMFRCYDELRRQIRERDRLVPLRRRDENGAWVDFEMAAPQHRDPVTEVICTERIEILRETLEELGDTCRTVIEHFYAHGKSYADISDTLDISVKTVGSRLSKCLGKLRAMLSRRADFREVA